jgi:hypothetical protein
LKEEDAEGKENTENIYGDSEIVLVLELELVLDH